MNNYYLQRTGRAILTFIVVITLTFLMIRLLPGGPVDYLRAQMVQSGQYVDPATINRRVELFTNVNPSKPIYIQYFDYVTGLAQGDMGRSIWYNDSVVSILSEAAPWTVLIMTISLFLSFSIAIILGAMMAYTEGSQFDSFFSVASTITSSIPYYVIGLLFLLILSYQWKIFPTSGRVNPQVPVGLNLMFIKSVLWHAILPIASLTISLFGIRALAMRGNSIQILGNDYLRVARLRGLSERRIALRYVGRNALLPMYTSIMIAIGTIFGGSVILEQIFAYPGLGYYLFKSIGPRDYPLMMGCFLLITLGVVIGIYIADLTYGIVDPRASTGGNHESF